MATMKDIIQSPLLALFGSMALGLFASSSSGSKVVKGGIKGVLPVLVIMTVLSLAARLAGYGSVLRLPRVHRCAVCAAVLAAGRPCGHLHHRDAAHRHPYLLCAVEEGQDPGSR